NGVYPSCDPYGAEFSETYMPERYKLAGLALAGNYKFVLDGVQADQDYVRTQAGTVCAMANMAEIMARNTRVLTESDMRLYKMCALAMRCGYMKMAVSAHSKRQLRWKLRPKWHQLACHLVPLAPLNPRYFANYLDEDYVRRIKQLAVRRTAAGMSSEVCQRYCIQVCLRWASLYGNGVQL
ncbi:unnamed protein product, partial [Effrenium voratum]